MDIRDIARLSGYSLGTVSRVINDKPNVSDRARKRVMEVVREQGFEPNPNAKHLKQASRSSVGVLVKGAHNQLFAEVVEHAQSLLNEAGEETQLVYLDEDADEVAQAIHSQRVFRFKGLIFLGGDLQNFRDRFDALRVPCVLLTNTGKDLGFENLCSFTTDDAAAAAEVVDGLVAAGHRRIGVIGGSRARRRDLIGTTRINGALEAFARNGVAFDLERDFEPSRFSMEEGAAAALRLLERRPDLTAVFCLGDAIAIGALRALHDLGRRVPEDVSVAGFDGLEISQYVTPRLRTIRQDTGQMAACGVAALLERIEDPGLAPVHETVPHCLIEGESVAAPPGPRA